MASEHDLLRLSVPATRSRVRPVAERVAAAAREHGVPVARVDDVAGAVAEVLANAVVHGSLDAPGVHLEVLVARADACLVVEVRDPAMGPPGPVEADVRARRLPDPGSLLAHGRPMGGWGLPLARQWADGLSSRVDATGRTVRLTFHVAS